MRKLKIVNAVANPTHNVTVNLIGCGGTGSRVLTGLAMINKALLGLDKAPIDVIVFDDDKVTEANLGRQMFAPADIGRHKSVVLVSRINRFYGFDWDARTMKYDKSILDNQLFSYQALFSNITIMCVDKISARSEIVEMIMDMRDKIVKGSKTEPYNKPFYIIDSGNNFDRGQIVLQTVLQEKVDQGEEIAKIDGSWWLDMEDNLDEPSCSMAESLRKQSLFINTIVADYTCLLVWDILTKKEITKVGSFVNLENYKVNPVVV
jgi:PRTRC genetic system ThiF family protein